MVPEPVARKLLEPAELPVWGKYFLGFMAASVVAQLLLITLSVARVLPHLRLFLKPAHLGLFLYWGFAGLGCLGFLALFWSAFRRLRRIHLAVLGLAAFAVLLHGFLAFALQLLLGTPGSDSGLGRSVWGLLQPGHATSFLILGLELLRTVGGIHFPVFGRLLRVLFLLDAVAVAGLYLLLWVQAGPERPRQA